MQKTRLHVWIVVCSLVMLGGLSPLSAHAQWVAEGQAPEGRWTAGFRAGFSPMTQEMFGGSDTSV